MLCHRASIDLTNTLLDEHIDCWNVVEKQYEEVEYVAAKITKLVVMSYDSICLMCCLGGMFCHRSLSAIFRKKIGKPKEEIENLNGFEYMYLSDLTVAIFLVIILHIH
jgi:hypothetical protein